MNDETEKQTLWKVLRGTFGRGVVVIVPVVITVWVLNLFFGAIDGTLSPVYDQILGRHIRGLGFVTMIVLILIFGGLSRNLIGRTLGRFFERIIVSIPLARTIYSTMRELVKTFQAGSKGKSFRQVVLLEYPRPGMFTIGFVTNEIMIQGESDPNDTVSVYILNPPNPTSGVLVLVPRKQAKVLNMSVEEGLKFVLSGGIVSTGTLSIK
ncbi:MAG: DUF502 domain-containing protein [Bacteroidota bacterium]|jgi:uncharacterized membrane protein